MQPFDLCRFTAYRPKCCAAAIDRDKQVGLLAALNTPLRECTMPSECQCMVTRVDDEDPPERPQPPTNVVPISRGRKN